LQFWIDRDAKGAAEWISKSAPLGYRMFALDAAVERVAASDPKDALRYVGSGHRADTRLLKPLIRGWVRSGQPGVEDWIRDLDYGFKRQKALGAYARARIAHDGAAAAIAWLEGLPDTEDGFKGEAFLRMTTELTYADPAAGVAWYEKHRDGPYGAGLMTTVADAWAGVDGPAAMHWVSQQPPGKERDDAVLDGIRSWGIVDVQGMKRWARSAERLDDWFQPGLPILSRLLAADDPAEGIRYAERITDEERRHLTLLQIARQWHASDPAAAEAWLAQSPLTEEERERALQVSTPGGRKPAAPAPAAP